MDLRFNTSLAEGYKSASQIARVLTEDWLNIRLEEIVKEQITSNMSSDYGEKKCDWMKRLIPCDKRATQRVKSTMKES